MHPAKKEHPKEKDKIHPRSKHRERYDFDALKAALPELTPFVKPNEYGDLSIDFFNPDAVTTLNKAILKHTYGIVSWNIPKGYLCPPIPGRADYIHHIADLLASCNKGIIPSGANIRCLDIGVGASCIYPIIGNKEYGWSFVGSDIDRVSVESSRKIVKENVGLSNAIEIRMQYNSRDFFNGILKENERFDLSICNPPFHASSEEAQAGSIRKLSNLSRKKVAQPVLNFGGKSNELWTKGGEARFVKDLVWDSKRFSDSCLWFSSYISKQANLKSVYDALEKAGALEVKTIEMGQGNKTGRIVAWTFFSKTDQKKWAFARWKPKTTEPK